MLLQTTGVISFCMITLVVFLFLFRYNLIKNNVLFFVLCSVCLAYETVMLITSIKHIENHFIANIYTILYFPVAFLLVFNYIEKVRGTSKATTIIKWILFSGIFLIWLLENTYYSNLHIYNIYTPAIISTLLVMFSIYLINVLIFIKTTSILRDSDGLMLIGLLVRSFASGLLSLFFNYKFQYSTSFYVQILILFNFALILSDILFLFSVVCLPQKKKYTWPF